MMMSHPLLFSASGLLSVSVRESSGSAFQLVMPCLFLMPLFLSRFLIPQVSPLITASKKLPERNKPSRYRSRSSIQRYHAEGSCRSRAFQTDKGREPHRAVPGHVGGVICIKMQEACIPIPCDTYTGIRFPRRLYCLRHPEISRSSQDLSASHPHRSPLRHLLCGC